MSNENFSQYQKMTKNVILYEQVNFLNQTLQSFVHKWPAKLMGVFLLIYTNLMFKAFWLEQTANQEKGDLNMMN